MNPEKNFLAAKKVLQLVPKIPKITKSLRSNKILPNQSEMDGLKNFQPKINTNRIRKTCSSENKEENSPIFRGEQRNRGNLSRSLTKKLGLRSSEIGGKGKRFQGFEKKKIFFTSKRVEKIAKEDETVEAK